MIAIEDVEAILADHCLVLDHDMLERGHTRIGTKLTMLDGSGIDVFLEGGHLKRDVGFALSDFGQTLQTLSEYGIRYKDRTGFIRSAIDSSGVRLLNDRLVLELSTSDELSEGIITLAQACLRVSCIAYMRKSPGQKTIRQSRTNQP